MRLKNSAVPVASAYLRDGSVMVILTVVMALMKQRTVAVGGNVTLRVCSTVCI